jgi:hypothetical protein
MVESKKNLVNVCTLERLPNLPVPRIPKSNPDHLEPTIRSQYQILTRLCPRDTPVRISTEEDDFDVRKLRHPTSPSDLLRVIFTLKIARNLCRVLRTANYVALAHGITMQVLAEVASIHRRRVGLGGYLRRTQLLASTYPITKSPVDTKNAGTQHYAWPI